MKSAIRIPAILALAWSLVWACTFDTTLREYLSANFWLPFAKRPACFERPNVKRIDFPYAGMTAAHGQTPLNKLRAAYQGESLAQLLQAIAIARADTSLTTREKEEVDLIDAKIGLNEDEPNDPQSLESAKTKLEAFLKTTRTPAFRSEARGWLARVYHLQGNQTAAGKIYLDELNRDGSNLSRETLLNSLRMTYGYDGGPELAEHIEEYFDTPDHAAFAIQLVTNPHWNRDDKSIGDPQTERFKARNTTSDLYPRIKNLLQQHRDLLQSNRGANSLAMLSMRTALRMGDPAGAARIAAAVPGNAAIRSEPDFNWMLASSHFLARNFAAAGPPLLKLFRSRRASDDQRAAAAYALCGVYSKTGNVEEQIRYALWLHTAVRTHEMYLTYPGDIADGTVYWASSGWDLATLLDAGAPIEALKQFVKTNPNVPDIRIVQYSLAVRLTRENRYQEAAEIYESINAKRRAPRMRQLAELYQQAKQSDEGKYKLAELIIAHPNGIYYNDAIWGGQQRYALQAPTDYRLNRAEHEAQVARERKLRDDQEERWRAYKILSEVIQRSGDKALRRKATILAIRCLDGINKDRFGREEEIEKDENALLAILHIRPLAGQQQ